MLLLAQNKVDKRDTKPTIPVIAILRDLDGAT
jgi:hypothetical protein